VVAPPAVEPSPIEQPAPAEALAVTEA
jgi:hypothetical protein